MYLIIDKDNYIYYEYVLTNGSNHMYSTKLTLQKLKQLQCEEMSSKYVHSLEEAEKILKKIYKYKNKACTMYKANQPRIGRLSRWLKSNKHELSKLKYMPCK